MKKMQTANRTETHTALCKAIQDYLWYQGGWCFKALGGLGVRRGLPDIHACLKGNAVYIEVKTGEGKLSPDQMKEKARIEQAGGIYIEARSVDDVEDRLVQEGLVLPGLC
jgi:hypothetical protein